MNPNVTTVHVVAPRACEHPATPPTPSTFLDDLLSEIFKGISDSSFTAHLSADADPFANGWNAAVQYMNEQPASVSAPPVPPMPLPINVIFNDPATVVYWSDATKTVVKCQPGDTFSAETGLTTAMLKKYMGNDNTFNKIINYWLKRTGHYNPALPAPEIPVLPEATPPIDGDNEVTE